VPLDNLLDRSLMSFDETGVIVASGKLGPGTA
jgi:hypothetical protein